MRQGPGAPRAREWITLQDGELPVAASLSWAVEPSCGGVVSFTGTVRDHAEDRRGVTSLEYEAYEEGALAAMANLAAAARERWPDLGRIALHHRVGRLELCEVAVVVVVAAPHRGEAFEAARWCIDTLKATVPIWKYETWEEGAAWSACATPLAEAEAGPSPDAPGPAARGEEVRA